MPSNIIRINNSDNYKWVVSDSKIDEVIEKLNDIGEKVTNEFELSKDKNSFGTPKTTG